MDSFISPNGSQPMPVGFKHFSPTAAAAEIAGRIVRREYRKTLPSVRELAAALPCAARTAETAVRLLAAAGRVELRDRATARIPTPHRARHKLALVVTPGTVQGAGRTATDALAARAAADGFDLELIPYAARHFSPRPERIFSRRYAGFIFIFSTLTPDIAVFLSARNRVFVSGNRLVGMPGLNCVEHDNEAALRTLVTTLYEKGYRKIGLFFPGALESYGDWSRRIWRKIKREFELEELPIDRFRVDWALPNELKLRRLERFLDTSTSQLPEAVICWNRLPDTVAIRPDILICHPGNQSAAQPNSAVFQLAENATHQLLDGLYEAWRELLWFPPPKPLQRLAPMELSWLREPPPFTAQR